MAKIGTVIVMGAILSTMAFGIYMYTQYQTNYITSVVGETVTVGPVEYVITFEGTHKGSDTVVPKDTFVKIGITAKNTSNEKTPLTGGQFYIVDGKEQKHKAVYGEFSSKDLLVEWLEPSRPVEITTQFDISFDEKEQYKIIIRPQKEQSTVDTAVVCITNC